MIATLRIRELALVEDVELDFASGLNVLTGETGAGKSVVLGALGLLAGGRARADLVRDGAEEAVVEAVIDTSALPDLDAELEGRGLAAEEHEVIVRRTLPRSGRGRAFVAGRQVPIGSLAELFAEQVEISSQHASQRLLRPAAQGRALDAYGDLLGLRARVEEGVRGLRAREEEIAALRADADERARREDFLAFQVGEIDEAGLEPGEDERLEAEHGRLVHAERLRGEAADAAARLLGDPTAPDAPGAEALLSGATRSVAELARLDPGLAELAERLAAVQAETADVARDLERYAQGVEGDPARLAEVEARIGLLERFRRKYGEGVEEILAFRERAAAELAGLGGSDERLRKLESEREAERARVAADARALSEGRAEAARALGAAASEALRALAMPDARVDVVLEPVEAAPGAPCGPSGAEAAVFHLSANPGETPRPLRDVASGGELSRAFLALKNVLRRADGGMVLVFDEVDAGIGGGVAERVGAALTGLAAGNQVLCITHLPQVAVQPARHFRVHKRRAGGRHRTEVERLDGAERVEEIARMAGGARITAATRRHAEDLLARAAGRVKSPRRGSEGG